MLEYEIYVICQEKCSIKRVTRFLNWVTSILPTTVTNKPNVKEKYSEDVKKKWPTEQYVEIELIKVELPQWKSWKADVSRVNPSSGFTFPLMQHHSFFRN